MDTIKKVNLEEAFGRFSEIYTPKIVGEVNDMHVKLVKLCGDFSWHHHEREDELFFVVKGSFTMKLHGGDVCVRQNEFIIIPSGVEHCPAAEEECHVLLFEPKTTLNTGNVKNAFTQERLQSLAL